jgi:16S rRNA (uracil1498-N3)-methyltransferase
MNQPRYRLAVDAALHKGAQISLRDNVAHYLTGVLRLGVGDAVALFSKADGQWHGIIQEVRKKEVVLLLEEQMRTPASPLGLTVCFCPIKGGRMETIIEKATELGASVLQPVISARTIVDKVNLERAEALAREAAEQCERIEWPEIREPVKLLKLLGDWPSDMPLVYGDESGASAPIHTLAAIQKPKHWGILAGPEGGFTPDEFAALSRVKATVGVGLGPRILRADTAVITLCVATLERWGDWAERPRFLQGEM